MERLNERMLDISCLANAGCGADLSGLADEDSIGKSKPGTVVSRLIDVLSLMAYASSGAEGILDLIVEPVVMTEHSHSGAAAITDLLFFVDTVLLKSQGQFHIAEGVNLLTTLYNLASTDVAVSTIAADNNCVSVLMAVLQTYSADTALLTISTPDIIDICAFAAGALTSVALALSKDHNKQPRLNEFLSKVLAGGLIDAMPCIAKRTLDCDQPDLILFLTQLLTILARNCETESELYKKESVRVLLNALMVMTQTPLCSSNDGLALSIMITTAMKTIHSKGGYLLESTFKTALKKHRGVFVHSDDPTVLDLLNSILEDNCIVVNM
jgi:hypothetical protein